MAARAGSACSQSPAMPAIRWQFGGRRYRRMSERCRNPVGGPETRYDDESPSCAYLLLVPFDFSTLRERLDDLYTFPAGPIRGNALEQLVEQLLSAIPGVVVLGRNITGGHQ